MKKTKIYQTKSFTVKIVQENHSQITIITLDNNHLTEITTVEGPQTKKIHAFSHKIDIFDQIVKTINIEIIIQDQIQTEVTTPITIEIVQIQTLKRHTVPKIPRITETVTTQTKGIDNTQIKDHETIQTTDQTIIIITIDYVTIPITKILTIPIDKEIILSHQIGIIHLNIKDKSAKFDQLKKPNQTLMVLITHKNSELQQNHIYCESTDDESETEITLSTSMLQIEIEYEAPIELIHYQNNKKNLIVLKNQIIHKT